MATPAVIGTRHHRIAREVRQTLAQYEEVKDIIAMLGIEQLARADRATVHKARRLERFLTQPFFTTEHFSNMKGRLVSLDDALEGCEQILAGKFDECPEQALYMVGNIDDARKKWKELEKNDEK
jgi:F-type H+-transporting ATPase subunit beta